MPVQSAQIANFRAILNKGLNKAEQFCSNSTNEFRALFLIRF